VPERIRWTLAHELGHVLLEHHKISDKTKIFRSTLSDNEYSWMEAEAYRLASLLLANPIILDRLNINSEADIKRYCNISLEASTYRYKSLLKWQKNRYTTKYDLIILKQFENFLNKNTCVLCNHTFYIKSANFCPICGNYEFNKEESDMIYDGINVNENSKALTCPNCENEQINENGDYCKICGTYLINRCSNIHGYNTTDGFIEACGKLTDGNARYCHHCGEKTTFYNNKMLKSWEQEKATFEFLKEVEALSPNSQTVEYDEVPF
ncbi:ImmA/IrrE family metallo-endopeptidase, partial [Bacillus cereus]|uniref:ImmA/IrrE family metallo-endopeptidase n=1 Tax=Bacillus cereus TaxID=1396 RepID=UPI002149BEB8